MVDAGKSFFFIINDKESEARGAFVDERIVFDLAAPIPPELFEQKQFKFSNLGPMDSKESHREKTTRLRFML